MSDRLDPIGRSRARIYQIRVKGHLDDGWQEWFQGLTITTEGACGTLLAGVVVDQAALHGLLKMIRDLGLTLISVNPVQIEQDDSVSDPRCSDAVRLESTEAADTQSD